jgi:hypothetical protein
MRHLPAHGLCARYLLFLVLGVWAALARYFFGKHFAYGMKALDRRIDGSAEQLSTIMYAYEN